MTGTLQLAHELNQLQRRFRQYEKEADWLHLVMEGAGNYSQQCALFAVRGAQLKLRAAVNLEWDGNPQLPAAFDAVVRSKETLTVLRTVAEVGEALSSPGRVAHLFPIQNGPRVVAILFAPGEGAEVDQLELIANMAASALERRTNSSLHSPIAAVAPAPAQRRLPPWADMPADQRALHSQAARFARVTVAELELFKPAACRAARENGDLYVLLNKEIDKARETYRQRFMILPSMTDYFHKELVGSILAGDGTKLGADYPGELA